METWKDVVGYKGLYEVSDMGRVRDSIKGTIRKVYAGRNGYLRTFLMLNGSPRKVLTHCLVMEAFVGKRPEGLQIDHIDGDKGNNSLSNLEYVTRSTNIKRAFNLGLKKATKGEKSVLAKFSDAEMLELKKILHSGLFSQCAISRAYKYSQASISLIYLGKTWGHVKWPLS